MRKNIVAGNWKMNTTLPEGLALAKGLDEALKGKTPNCDVIIGTPFTHLASIAAAIDTNKIGVAAENCADKEKGAFKDAYLADDRLNEMAADLYKEYGSRLLYGPVEIPEYDSEVYGFLAADGDNLEDIWYGIWHAPLENQTFPITKMPLFK